MNTAASHLTRLVTRPNHATVTTAATLQQRRGIRVKVENGNLEQALQMLQRKMQSSGVERMIKKHELRHIKNSEKRVLARKNLELRVQTQNLAQKLKTILTNKVRGL